MRPTAGCACCTLAPGGNHMQPVKNLPLDLPPHVLAAYHKGLEALEQAETSFLVGGAFALERYAGVVRYTKDFDLFLRPDDCPKALRCLATVGFQTEITFPHWLGKARWGEDFIDLIFSS